MATQVAPLAEPYPSGVPALVVAGSVAALTLYIPGDPIPKGRPRTRVVNGKAGKSFANVYTDPKTREWEEHVESHARHQLDVLGRHRDGQQLRLPFRGRVLVDITFYVHRPKSYPKSVTIPITARGDIDNMGKSALDGMQNAGIFANDRLITDLNMRRRYADAAHPEGVAIDLTGFA